MNFHEDITELATADPDADLASIDTSAEPVAQDDFATELDPFAGASSRRKLGSGPFLIVAVVLIAVAGLFSMRKIAEVTAASGIDSEIEATIVKFLESIGESGASTPAPRFGVDYETLLGVITESYSERQVPLRDVQRDPFVIEILAGTGPVDPSMDPDVKAAEALARRREAKQVELKAVAEGLRLKSIMGGSTPIALIDGEILHVGDTISSRRDGEVFRVTKIGRSSVELLAEVPELDLQIRVTLFLRDR